MTKAKSENLIKRQNRVYIRYSDAEYHLLEHRAKEVGCPLAVLVRKLSLKEPVNIHYHIVADLPELQKLTVQLASIGNNLNQIARHFNTGGMQSRAIHEEINRCMTALFEMREELMNLGGKYNGNLKTPHHKKC